MPTQVVQAQPSTNAFSDFIQFWQNVKAIAVAREALAQLGIELPTEVDKAQIDEALQDLNNQLQGREITGLIDLPVMSDRPANC